MAQLTPTIVQVKTGTFSATSGALTLDSAVTAGNYLAVLVGKSGTLVQTLTITDNKSGNTWASVKVANPPNATGRQLEMVRCHQVVNGGSGFQVTATWSGNPGDFYLSILELSDVRGTTPEVVTGDDDLGAGTATTHHCATSGNIDTSVGVVMLAGGSLAGAATTITPNAGFTDLGSTTTERCCQQYKRSTTAVTDERATYTTALSRNSASFIVAVQGADAGSGSKPWLYRAHTQTLGAGFSRGAL